MGDDIWESATAAVDHIRHVHDSANKARVIYDAILAERERCAEVARTIETPEDGEYWIAERIARHIESGQ